MKYFLLIGIFFIHQVCAQSNKDVSLSVENIDSFSFKKERLFIVSKQWVVDEFANASFVLQNDDKENGHLSGKFSSKAMLSGKIPATYFATFSIDCRDNKTRIRIYDAHYSFDGYPSKYSVDSLIRIQVAKDVDYSNDKLWNEITIVMQKVMDDYKNYLTKNADDKF